MPAGNTGAKKEDLGIMEGKTKPLIGIIRNQVPLSNILELAKEAQGAIIQ